MKRSLLLMLLTLITASCVRLPDGVTAVEGVDLESYLGTWYEIARLDHPFERGLSHVSATYSRRLDGGIDVVNRGYHRGEGKWKEASGKAYAVGDPSLGRLKVSFFGPFYGAYNIIALDQADYSWSLVCGPNRDYLWILSRTPVLEEETVKRLLGLAEGFGFPLNGLITVEQDPLTRPDGELSP